MNLSELSTEYLRISVPGNTSAYTGEVAIVEIGAGPPEAGDWAAGAWTVEDVPKLEVLVGATGAIVITEPGTYEVWTRLTDSPEVIVRLADLLVVTPASGYGQAYATPDDVARQAAGRRFDSHSKPTEAQVLEWLGQIAGVINSVMRGLNYELPIPADAAEALRTLQHGNALGVAAMVEQSAPTSERRAEARQWWKDWLEMLKDGSLELDGVTKSGNVSLGRANFAATPFFSRDMEL